MRAGSATVLTVNAKRWAAILATVIWPWLLNGAAPQLKYVVIIARHGVRSPTWDAARLNQYSAQPWPAWGVPPGYLTPRGRELIQILGSYYREWLADQHLLYGKECRDRERVYIWADTEQRTLETGRAFSGSVLPGCGVPVNSRRPGAKDPIFEGLPSADAQRAGQEVRRRLGSDPQKLLADHRIALDTLQWILDGGQGTPKRLVASRANVEVAVRGRTIELEGPFAAASTLSENLLLEYANGMSGRDLGWGRLTKDNLFQVLELHRQYADLMRRTPYLARARGSNLLAHVLASIEQAASGKAVRGALGPPTDALLILSGHDTNQSNVAGMLGLSWTLPGFQPDETPPGGSLIFSLWQGGDKTADGEFFVRAEYLAASLEQMRNRGKLTLATPPLRQAVPIPGCQVAPSTMECTWTAFQTVIERSINGSQVDFDFR
jgi:4-phytase / acid phosphatase